MNARIKELRKFLNLTLEDFGSRIGMGKSAISKVENGTNGTTEQTIKSICREFGVSEEWLRTGQGEMLRQDNQSVLDRVAEEYHFTQQERAVLNAYLELSTQDRAAVMRYVDNLVSALAAPPSPVSDTAAAAVAAMQDYAAMVAEEKSPPESSSTSAG